MSLTVKATLHRAEPEIRRFTVPADVSSSFEYLKKKISDIFPDLRQGNFTLHWKDHDGDVVTFNSDEELLEALGFVNDGLLRISINERKPQSGSEPSQDDASGVRHPNVVCDGCETGICGVRYKCVICPDYDLCSQCEKKGIHGDHDMMKITTPVNNGAGMFGSFFGGPPPPPPHGPHGSHGFVPPPHFRRWMQRFMKRWHNRNAPGWGSEENQAPEGEEPQEDPQNQGEGTPEEEYLKNIGESVQAMLDPFGIDVDVDIETNGQRTPCGGHRGRSAGRGNCRGRGRGHWGGSCPRMGPHGFMYGCPQGRSPCKKADKPKPKEAEPMEKDSFPEPMEKEFSPDQPMEKAVPQPEQEPAPMYTETSDKGKEADEWTVLTEDTVPDGTQSSSAHAPAPIPPIPAPTAPEQLIYPPSDPKIIDALTQMLAMGFHNEGGWLQQLLQGKDGDIGKVLDDIKKRQTSRQTTGGYMA